MKTIIYKFSFLILAFAVCTGSAFAQLTVSLTTSNYNGYNVSCFGGTNGSITATPSGGTSPYTYLWSNVTATTTQTISSVSASYYMVTVTDASHNTATAGVTLSQPAAMSVSVTSSAYSNGYNVSCYQCFNGSITNTPSGGVTPYTYSWNSGSTAQNRSSIGGGAYSVTVTDANSCTKIGVINVSEAPRDNWAMGGNSGSNPSTQYIGTADNTDLVFKTNTTERMRVASGGNVGIGTNSPTALLDVNGGAKISGSFLAAGSVQLTGLTIGSDPCGALLAVSSTGFVQAVDGSCQFSSVWNTSGNLLPNNTSQFIGTANNYDFRIKTNNVERVLIKADGKVGIRTSSPSSLFEVKGTGTSSSSSSLNVTNSSGTSLLFVRDDGHVGIANTSPSYLLDVDGTVRSQEVRVCMSGCDFVFEKDYPLMSLKDMENFITKHRRLPAFASAKEMEESDGVALGKMNSGLLQNVEELYLHLIELNKKLERVANENIELKKEVELLSQK